MTTSQILEGDLKLNPGTMTLLANLRQAKAEIDDLYGSLLAGVGVTDAALAAHFAVQRNPTTGQLEIGGVAINGIPSYTFSGRPDAASVAIASLIRHPRSEFTFVGGAALTSMPSWGIVLQSDGVNWRTPYKQLYAEEFSTKASPFVTIPTAIEAVETDIVMPNGNILFPVGMIFTGFKLSIQSYWGKGTTSAAGSTFYTKFGPSATVLNNPIVGFDTVTNAASKQQEITTFLNIINTTSITWSNTVPNSAAGVVASGGLGGFMDVSVTHAYGSTYKLSFTRTNGTGGGTNTDYMFGYRIFLEV